MSLPAVGGTFDPEQTFLASLPAIERILTIIVARNALPASDVDEFRAWAKARLIAGNYAVFQKFRGRSAMETYLTTVLVNLFRDYRNSAWGRWRPSAAAKKLGPIGVRLEELVRRDGYPLREAIEILRAAGVPQDDATLARMAASLPDRTAHEVALGAVEENEAALAVDPVTGPDDLKVRLERALRGLVAELPDEDMLIVRMRFWDNVTVADIARTLGGDQKALYRRLEAIERKLRAALESCGFDQRLAAEALWSTGAW